MTRPTALVTGASSGIGEAIARRLAQRGHDLVLVARDRERLEALAKEVEADHGATAEVLPADLSDAVQLQAVEDRCRDRSLPISVMVNNAGVGSYGDFHTLAVESEVREINLNVVALVRLTHAAVSEMVPRGSGGILNVSSLAGFQPSPMMAVYCATKSFVTSFTESVHEEVKGSGVAVTALCPGFTRTGFQTSANVPAATELPGFMWQEADEVAVAGLDGLARNRAVVLPGALNKGLGAFSSVMPHAITRRIGGAVVKRTAS